MRRCNKSIQLKLITFENNLTICTNVFRGRPRSVLPLTSAYYNNPFLHALFPDLHNMYTYMVSPHICLIINLLVQNIYLYPLKALDSWQSRGAPLSLETSLPGGSCRPRHALEPDRARQTRVTELALFSFVTLETPQIYLIKKQSFLQQSVVLQTALIYYPLEVSPKVKGNIVICLFFYT